MPKLVVPTFARILVLPLGFISVTLHLMSMFCGYWIHIDIEENDKLIEREYYSIFTRDILNHGNNIKTKGNSEDNRTFIYFFN